MKATPVFEKNWNALQAGNFKYIVNSGSSRSSKTFSILQIYWLLAWSKPRTKLSAFRVTKKDCKDTILQDMLKYYPTLPNWEKVVFNKTESIFSFPNGSQIFIEGTDDDLKVMGYHSDYLWFNEFYRISKDTFDQLDMRCSSTVFMDYNPVGTHWIEDLINRDNACLIHSTFKDNPFVPEEQKKKILSYEPTEYNIQQKTADTYKWQVFGLGLKAEKPNRIFKGWTKITSEEFDAMPFNSYFGLDFGTTNPTALVEVKHDGEASFFIKKRLYTPLNKLNEEGGMSRALEVLKIKKADIIIADPADKENRQDLMRNGYNILGWKPSSVLNSINLMCKYKIYYVDDSDLEFEYENYEWEIFNGMNLERPIKKDDHLLDASRGIIAWLCNYLSIK